MHGFLKLSFSHLLIFFSSFYYIFVIKRLMPNHLKIFSEISLYSVIANSIFIITTMLPITSMKINSKKDLDKAICHLRIYVIMASIWMIILMLFMYKKYQLPGLLYSTFVNMSLIMMITLLYWNQFRKMSFILGFYPSGGVGNYDSVDENSSPYVNPSKYVEMPYNVSSCSLDDNNYCSG